MLELAHKVQKIVNPKAGLVYRENTLDDPTKRKPDITKAMRDLQWEPKVNLEQGLELMVEDFRKRVHTAPEPSPLSKALAHTVVPTRTSLTGYRRRLCCVQVLGDDEANGKRAAEDPAKGPAAKKTKE
jgi:hypothetical protein